MYNKFDLQKDFLKAYGENSIEIDLGIYNDDLPTEYIILEDLVSYH